MDGNIKSTKSDLKGDIETLKSDLERDIETLKSDLERDIDIIRGDLQDSRQDHLEHLKDHSFAPLDSPNSQRGGSTEDDHRERTRPGTPQGDRSETQ